MAPSLVRFRRAQKPRRLSFPRHVNERLGRKAGRFHLLPSDHLIGDLCGDYKEMKAMIFGAYPERDTIIEGLAGLERRINNLG